MFGRQHGDFSVIGYMDANYAEYLDDRRSTTGYIFTLVGRSICWKYFVQSLVTLYMTKLKYMAVVETINEALWFTRLVKELSIHQGGVQFYCDS